VGLQAAVDAEADVVSQQVVSVYVTAYPTKL